MKKVLIVDDTKNIRFLLTTFLKSENYDVYNAGNGEEALELFNREIFDLAFLDIKMPEISGTEILKKIRKMGIDIPVIIMTGFATVKNAVECTKLGAVAYIQKPFTTDKIRTVLNEIVNFKNEDLNDINYFIKSGKQFLLDDNYNSSYDMFKKALSIDPTNKEIYRLISELYEKMGNGKESERFKNIWKQFK